MALTPRHRQELIAIGALLAGVFVALTLLPWDLTGPVGRIFGGFLWRVIGIGAVLFDSVVRVPQSAGGMEPDIPRRDAVLSPDLTALDQEDH